ncbi:MAG: glycosyltransferase family 1 protein, partial [Actinobacteria bacterium]|nr:glycosyltransferase family 1 protein [Actinomycetota bacterium]
SLPEVAGEAALSVDPRSEQDIADALEQILTDSDLSERLQEAGRARAARFSWERTAEQTLEVYRSLL